MPIRSITFDLDGTLLDTIPDLVDGCQRMLAELGAPMRSAEEIHRFVGKGMAVLVERCLTWDCAPDTSTLEAGIAAFRRHYVTVNGQKTRIYPGVIEGLNAFRAAGLPLAVVTNKPGQFTLPLLARMGLAGYFAAVVSGDSTPYKKPHPAPLHEACAQLGSPASDNLHIGDSENDVLAAHAAGSLAYLVPYGYNEGQSIDNVKCDALVSDLLAAYRHAFPEALHD